MTKRLVQLFLACIAIGISGCAPIPPDHDALPQQDLARVQLASDIKLAREGWPDTQWWQRFGDPQLDRLIDSALHDGPSLQVAATRVESARAALALDRADSGSSVNFKAASNRQRYSANGLFPPPIGGSYYTESTLQLVATYDFDWWGKRRASIAASLGELNASRAEYAQAEQTLAAAIAQSYFSLQGGWARLANLQQMRDTQNALLADQSKRVAHGLASSDEERNADEALSALNKEYAALDAQNAREREALRALLGADNTALTELAPHALPQASAALPSSLGIELLARRPDLQAARRRVEASLSRIEVARAAFYPDINLTGFFGSDALSFDKLLQASSRTLFIGPALNLPLFNSGTLQAGLGVARSQRNEMIADYNQSVFNAVRDVAQAGVSLQGLQREVQAQSAATQSVEASLRGMQLRFKQGLADNSGMLGARMAVFQQHDMDLQLQTQTLLTDVALTKALGGGYRVEPADTPPATMLAAVPQSK
jgi:multidrug efflux system outer membrane protein